MTQYTKSNTSKVKHKHSLSNKTNLQLTWSAVSWFVHFRLQLIHTPYFRHLPLSSYTKDLIHAHDRSAKALKESVLKDYEKYASKHRIDKKRNR